MWEEQSQCERRRIDSDEVMKTYSRRDDEIKEGSNSVSKRLEKRLTVGEESELKTGENELPMVLREAVQLGG